MKVLQAAASMNGELGDRLRKAIADEMKAARNRVVGDIKFDNGDPRGAAQSIRRIAYKKILGGNINILNGGKSGSRSNYEAPRKVYPGMNGQRGGNRMPRSQRTDDMLHYGPTQRGFILRVVNSGTIPRYSGGGRIELRGSSKRNFFKMQEEGNGYRGSIAPRNFFGIRGEIEMEKALSNLQQIIEEEFNKLFE